MAAAAAVAAGVAYSSVAHRTTAHAEMRDVGPATGGFPGLGVTADGVVAAGDGAPTFRVLPVGADGNCMFRALAQSRAFAQGARHHAEAETCWRPRGGNAASIVLRVAQHALRCR
jgi:hypothetical protein